VDNGDVAVLDALHVLELDRDAIRPERPEPCLRHRADRVAPFVRVAAPHVEVPCALGVELGERGGVPRVDCGDIVLDHPG